MDDAIYEHQCPFTVLRHVRSDFYCAICEHQFPLRCSGVGEWKARVAHVNALCDVQGMGFTRVSMSFVVV